MGIATLSRMRRVVAVLVFVVAVAGARAGSAEPIWPGTPTDAVRGHIDELLAIARDPGLTTEGREHAALAALTGMVDFTELSRHAFAEHWARMTRAERDDAAAGLRAMFGAAYVSRLRRHLGARVDAWRRRLRFVGESVSGGAASVAIRFAHGGQDIPLQLSLVRRGRQWRIC